MVSFLVLKIEKRCDHILEYNGIFDVDPLFTSYQLSKVEKTDRCKISCSVEQKENKKMKLPKPMLLLFCCNFVEVGSLS